MHEECLERKLSFSKRGGDEVTKRLDEGCRVDKRGIGRYSETWRIFGAVGKMYDPIMFGEFVKIGIANADSVLKRGSGSAVC